GDGREPVAERDVRIFRGAAVGGGQARELDAPARELGEVELLGARVARVEDDERGAVACDRRVEIPRGPARRAEPDGRVARGAVPLPPAGPDVLFAGAVAFDPGAEERAVGGAHDRVAARTAAGRERRRPAPLPVAAPE